MPGVELAVDEVGVYVTKNFVTVQNLNVQYTGTNSFMFHAMNNGIARDNTFSWAGGGNENGDYVRFGNAVDVQLTSSNILIERNFIQQAFDGDLAIEPLGGTVTNVTMRNNIMVNGTQGLAQLFTGAQIDQIFLYNNTGWNATGWSESQRWGAGPTWTSEAGQRYGVFPGVSPTPTNVSIRNNAFTDLGTSCSIVGTGGIRTMWQGIGPGGIAPYDYNHWHGGPAGVPRYCGSPTIPPIGNVPISTWAAGDTPNEEVHGSVSGVDPLFTDTTINNFTPQASSTLRSTGTNLYSLGVVLDFNRLPRPTSGNFTKGAIQ
jgi:hypothetical protein